MNKGFLISHRDMKNRCNNSHHPAYPRYGGRGITYDPTWETPEGFAADMLATWFDHATIDRIDSNGNYCKENCRWITKAEQNTLGRQGLRTNSRSGVKGVELFRGGYRVLVRERGYPRNQGPKKTLYSGPSLEEAIKVRQAWEAEQLGF